VPERSPHTPTAGSVIDRPGEWAGAALLRAVDALIGGGALSAVRLALVVATGLDVIRAGAYISSGASGAAVFCIANAAFTVGLVLPYLERTAGSNGAGSGTRTMNAESLTVKLLGRFSTALAVVAVGGAAELTGALLTGRTLLFMAACYAALDGGDGGGVSVLDRLTRIIDGALASMRPVPATVRS
jgi:hypothetical protein